MKVYFIFLTLFTLLTSCYNPNPKRFLANNKNYQYSGRYELLKDNAALISPGSSVTINFSGKTCKIYLKAEKEPYNYVSLELDGQYIGRQKISYQSIKEYVINVSSKKNVHTLKIIKESEASNGTVLFNGIKVEQILEKPIDAEFYIEFIGDSITCGAASDGSIIPCEEGEYFDHENVYYSYGASTARALNADFKLSSVSGRGIYRNWNDEGEKPTIPMVYENLYLDTANTTKNDFSKTPDIVSICLGTNDLSNGDGTKTRLAFNTKKYISNYIELIKTVYKHYPKTQVALLTSPMVIGENNKLLVSCLKEVQSYFLTNFKKSIVLFQFNEQYTNGCLWHPSVEEHKKMAKKLAPVFQKILNKK